MEPFTIMDYDYQNNKIEVDLNFPFACCCIGTSEETVVPVEEIGQGRSNSCTKTFSDNR